MHDGPDAIARLRDPGFDLAPGLQRGPRIALRIAPRIALLGAGRIGRIHARAIAGDMAAELVAVADAAPAAAQAVALTHECAIRSIAEIEAAEDVDAVVIATPADSHADLIERFARAGKAVFCEKPIDLSLARARACLKVVRETGATLMLGFHRRFDPHFAVLRAEIERGTIGDVEMVTLISREPGPPPSDGPARPGGIFRDMTLHDFDMARVLLGEEVAEVSAMASVLGDPATASAGDYDAVQVMLKTVSGKQAMISNSRRASYGHDRRIEVLGSKGAVAARTPRPVAIELATAAGFSRPAPQDVGMTRDAEAYAAEIAAFIAAVSSQAAVSPSGADGLAALALAEAAARSAAEGRAVQLSELAG